MSYNGKREIGTQVAYKGNIKHLGRGNALHHENMSI